MGFRFIFGPGFQSHSPFEVFLYCMLFSVYSKGYTKNWNGELFKLHKINNTNPGTFTLEDQDGEQKEGKYYERELLIKECIQL